MKDGHLAEEQRCYDFSIYYDFDYGHNGSDNCMESNLPEDYYEDYYSDTVQNLSLIHILLLLISMGEREWAISTYGYSHTVAFTDAGLEFISGQFQSKLSSGNYADAFNCFADQCDDFLRQAATGEPYDVDNMPSKGKVHPFWLVNDLRCV